MRGLLVVVAVLLGGAGYAQQTTASIFDHNHGRWNAILQEFVHEGGLVDYEGLQKQRSRLDHYLADLQSVQPAEFRQWSAKEREAFWINAYNAYAIQLILDHYPVDSIKDLGGFFSSVFDKRYIPLQHLAGVDARADASTKRPLSLGEVEHQILFPISRRPLFHFAIVCASASCPELRAEAYSAEKLDTQLEDQARRFLADSERNDTQIEGNKLRISKIFDWAEEELDSYPGGIRKLLVDFAPPAVGQSPALAKVHFRYRNYDWSLNAWHPKN